MDDVPSPSDADNQIMGKTLVAKFADRNEVLVQLLAEDRGFYRFVVLAGTTKGVILWVPGTGIEHLREATAQEIERQELTKRHITDA